jgi:cytoskeletal protein RodZ
MSIGKTLRLERERQGRALGDIADQLCIINRYMKAIEDDNREVLPGGFFYKSFVRQYAEILGMSAKEIERIIQAIGEESLPLPGADPRFPVRQPDPIIVRTNRRLLSGHRVTWSAVGLSVVVAGCTTFYGWWYRPAQAGIPAVSGPQAPAVQTSTPEPRVEPPPQQAVPVQPVAIKQIAPSDEVGQQVVLNVSATEKTWVSIIADGKVVFKGILEPSQTKTLTGGEVAKLTTGNAGGLDIRWNGRPIGPVGERGQVRVVKFTKDNFQISTATDQE